MSPETEMKADGAGRNLLSCRQQEDWGCRISHRKGENKMRKYMENGELKTVICNGCGKKLIVESGILREGACQVKLAWDFFSEKDGEIHRWDLCEECYDRLVEQFLIAPDVEEQVEFI